MENIRYCDTFKTFANPCNSEFQKSNIKWEIALEYHFVLLSINDEHILINVIFSYISDIFFLASDLSNVSKLIIITGIFLLTA